MVNTCCIFGRCRRGCRDKGTAFLIPSVITNQGEKTKELSSKQRAAWISSINRKDWVQKGLGPAQVLSSMLGAFHISYVFCYFYYSLQE